MKPDSDFDHSTITDDDDKSFASTLPQEAHDPNVLFAVLARQAGLITAEQLADGLTGLLQRAGTDLGDVLLRRGQIKEADRERIQSRVDDYVADHEPARDSDDADLTMPVGGTLSGEATLDVLGETEELQDSDNLISNKRLKLRFVHGEGGIGQVWMARDRILGRDIALKELKPGRKMSDAVRTRFLREVQITSQLQHPGTVPVYEFNDGAEDGRCYYTMKFLKGRTLTEVIREYHLLRRKGEAGIGDLIELLNMFDQVCDTISYAHSRGILHRDLKGDNIVVGEYGEVVVIDWGLAKRLGELEEDGESSSETMASIDLRHADALQTMHGEAVGTPAFMSPEQATGSTEDYDERTDVYGLAAILYEILAGVPPFVGKDVTSILLAVCTAPPNPPRLLNPSIPPELQIICLKGLSKDQADRQQSAAELAASVSGWISDQAERSRTEHEREQFFRMSLDVLATVDRNALIQQVNPAFVELFGWSEQELKNKSVFDIVHPDDVVDPKAMFQRILDGEKVTGLVRRCLCKDGSVVWMQWHLTKLADTPLVYVVGRDITEEKRDEQFFQALLDATPDPMVVTDANRIIRIVNRPLVQRFGYKATALIGQPVETLFDEGAKQSCAANFQDFISDPQCRSIDDGLSLTARDQQGVTFPVTMSMMLVDSDGTPMVASTIRT